MNDEHPQPAFHPAQQPQPSEQPLCQQQPYQQPYQQPGYGTQPPVPQAYPVPASKPDGIGIRLWRAAYPALLIFGVQVLAGIVMASAMVGSPMFRTMAGGYEFVWLVLLGTVASQVVAVPFLIAFRIMDGNRLRAKGAWKEYRLPGFGKLLLCFAMGIATALCAISLFELTGFGDDGTQELVFSASPFISVLVIGVIGPAVEELVFRVLLYSRLREWMAPVSAGLLSALVFTLAHGNVTQGVTAFFYGLLLAFVYERYKTFWAPFLLHAGINSTVVLTAVIGRGFLSSQATAPLVGITLLCAAVVVGLVVLAFKLAPAKEKELPVVS